MPLRRAIVPCEATQIVALVGDADREIDQPWSAGRACRVRRLPHLGGEFAPSPADGAPTPSIIVDGRRIDAARRRDAVDDGLARGFMSLYSVNLAIALPYSPVFTGRCSRARERRGRPRARLPDFSSISTEAPSAPFPGTSPMTGEATDTQYICRPPLIDRVEPVMKPASSAMRKLSRCRARSRPLCRVARTGSWRRSSTLNTLVIRRPPCRSRCSPARWH